MSNHEEICNDLDATVDYLHAQVIERSDSMALDEAAAIRARLLNVKQAVGVAISMLEQGMMTHVEAGAQQVGNQVFMRRKKYSKVVDHMRIGTYVRQRAINRAVDQETGEIDPHRAADEAVAAMTALYLSPSHDVKVGVLDKFEIDRKEVLGRESKGWELGIQDLEIEDDAD